MNNYAPDNIYLKYIKNNTNRQKKWQIHLQKRTLKHIFQKSTDCVESTILL